MVCSWSEHRCEGTRQRGLANKLCLTGIAFRSSESQYDRWLMRPVLESESWWPNGQEQDRTQTKPALLP